MDGPHFWDIGNKTLFFGGYNGFFTVKLALKQIKIIVIHTIEAVFDE